MRALPFLIVALLLTTALPTEGASSPGVSSRGSLALDRDGNAPAPARDPHALDRSSSRDATIAAERASAMGSAQAIGTGTLAGTLKLAGAPLADQDILFENFATGDSVILTTNGAGAFSGTVAVGRWFAWFDAVDDESLELEKSYRAKIAAGKTTSLAMAAVPETGAITFDWAATDEVSFLAYFYEAGTDLEGEEIFICAVDIMDEAMDCGATPTEGLTLFADLSDYDFYALDVLIIPAETSPFILEYLWVYPWDITPLMLYFDDALATLELDIGHAMDSWIADGQSVSYWFDLTGSKGWVGRCEVELYDGGESTWCWGGAMRALEEGGDGRTFLVPPGSYTITVHPWAAKDITVKKVNLVAGALKSVKAIFVPNTLTVSVSGTGAATATVAIAVFGPGDVVYYIWSKPVTSGSASFVWVPVGTSVVEAINTGSGTYAEAEKSFTGGAQKLKLTLK